MAGVNIRETIIGFGRQKQTNLTTANIAAQIWRLDKADEDLAAAVLATEDDKDFIGKGDEFVTRIFKSHWDLPAAMEKFITSEIIAWAAGFGLGLAVKTGVGPFTYTSVPMDPETDGIDLPSFSIVEQSRGGTVIDHVAIGVCLESFLCEINSGPGLNNSKITMEMVGTGGETTPSAIVIPAATTESILGSGSLAITALTINYVTLQNLIQVRWGFRNNIRQDTGYFPGGGTRDGAAIRGRMEYGDREPILEFTVRKDSTSDELAKLIALTSGTVVITQTNGASTYTVTFHQVVFKSVEEASEDGLLVNRVICAPQKHATNGLMTCVTVSAEDLIAQ